MQYITHILSKGKAMLGMATLMLPMCLWSCSSADEPSPEPAPEPREISFTGSCSSMSRTESALPTDYNMWVTAMYRFKNAGYYYLKNTKFAFDNDRWRCDGARAYYPLAGQMDFVGYASSGSTIPPNIITYTPLLNEHSLNDITYIDCIKFRFSGKGKLTGTDDVLVSQVTEDVACGLSDDREVQLKFLHLLCNIKFVFTAQTSQTENFMFVTAVELNDIRATGTATLSRTAKGKTWDLNWSELSDADTLRIAKDVPLPYRKDPTTSIDFYVPPQESQTPSFTVFYKYRNDEGMITDEMTYFTSPFPTIANGFETGKRYIYNIACKMLPHVEFRISFIDDTNGIVLDEWTVVPPISL